MVGEVVAVDVVEHPGRWPALRIAAIRSSAAAIAVPSLVITGSVISPNSWSPVRRSSLIAQSAKAGYSRQKSTKISDSVRNRLIGARGVVDRRHPLVQLGQVVHQGEREQLLLAGEVPVDQRLVDPDPRAISSIWASILPRSSNSPRVAAMMSRSRSRRRSAVVRRRPIASSAEPMDRS